jgi:oligopeptide transport system ATP-binding protein
MNGQKKTLLEVNNLETSFSTWEGMVHAVNGVSFYLKEGETLGIVGESGCGKSVTVLSLLRLVQSPPGKIINGTALFNGKDLLKMSEKELSEVRGSQISLIFQDPMTFFNPVLTIGEQVMEPLKLHLGVSDADAKARVIEILDMVGISNPEERLKDYPYQFSGGMRQRAMIAMALTCSPQILIADEPTTALDVTVQAQIVDLVKKLRDELGMSIIWITHDLGIVAGLVDRVAVMYAGYIVETAEVKELYKNPRHPYTIGLLGSLPRLDENERKKLVSIEGIPPVLYRTASTCPFAPRCPYRVNRCFEENPMLSEVNKGHAIACWVDVVNRKERV